MFCRHTLQVQRTPDKIATFHLLIQLVLKRIVTYHFYLRYRTVIPLNMTTVTEQGTRMRGANGGEQCTMSFYTAHRPGTYYDRNQTEISSLVDDEHEVLGSVERLLSRSPSPLTVSTCSKEHHELENDHVCGSPVS